MKKEYMIERQGKKFVLYPGLLAEAHERFDSFEIWTKLEDSGERPIVVATFYGHKEGSERPIITSGIGTAGRQSDRKGPAVDAPIEMAETRAKARALRDAVNVGVAALEELSEGDDGENSKETPTQNRRAPQTGNEAPQTGNVQGLRGQAKQAPTKDPNAIRKSQREMIEMMVSTIWGDGSAVAMKKILDSSGASSIGEMTKQDAEKIIQWLEPKMPEDEGITIDEDELEEG